MEAAGRYYRRALASNPAFADAYSELGNVAFAGGEYREAGDFYAKALEIRPDHGKALHSLGVLLFLAGSNEPAIDCLRRAQELDPSFSKTSFFLGQAVLKGGDAAGAIPILRKAVRTEGDPVYRALGMNFLAEALIASGAPREGVDQYRQALDVDSRCVPARAGLAWILATDPDSTSRDGATAVGIAERALTLEEPSARTLDALAASYAAIGRFPEAVEAAKAALEAARAQEETLLASRIEARIRLYEAGRPYRESPAR
jgi:tetratricopeptide (TPR) repeat protein